MDLTTGGNMAKKDRTKVSRHHRKCKSHGGSNCARNISIVPFHKHRAYHLLFQNMHVRDIAEYLNQVWIDPDFKLIVVRRDQ